MLKPARRDLRRAWAWVVLIPIAFVVATLFREWAVDLLGYQAGGDKPVWVSALVGVPVTVIEIFPGAAATFHGMRAKRAGLRRGRVPAVIGALVVLFWAVTTVAGVAGIAA